LPKVKVGKKEIDRKKTITLKINSSLQIEHIHSIKRFAGGKGLL